MEKALRNEFKEDLAKVRAECRSHLEVTVQEVWQDADKVREQAVTDARLDEQDIAREEACTLAEIVSEEKRKEKEEAEKEKFEALANLSERMNKDCQDALANKKRKMEEDFAIRTSEIQQKHESQVSGLEERLVEEFSHSRTLTTKIQEMTDSRDDWKGKYKDLKMEFSDFIDQFPGFRGEFIL